MATTRRRDAKPGRRAEPDDPLRLDRQLCFPLYAASRLVTRLYQPLLHPLGLTYPQYLVLLILWEDAPCSVSHVGGRALLGSNTLTPLLKRLEELGYVRRTRSAADERVVEVALTASGASLRSICSRIPAELVRRSGYSLDQAFALKHQLDQLIAQLRSLEDDGEIE